MTQRKEALAASLVIIAMLSVALITAANAHYRTTLGENNEYQFPWGTVYVKISGNLTSSWSNATLTLSNGTAWSYVFPSDAWYPTKDWLQRADLPWILYIPPTGSPNFFLDFSAYDLLPLAIEMKLTHVGYTYVCHIDSWIPGDLTIKWDDRSGILTEVDSGNNALVYLVEQNLV